MVKFICVSPVEYKLTCSKLTILYDQHESVLGKCLIGITSAEKAVCHLRFVDNNFSQRLQGLKACWPGATFILESIETKKLVERAFSANDIDSLTVYMKGTDFQIKVWKSLVDLPKGEIVGYEYVANLIKNPKAIRAVAKTVNSNEIAFVIPCHRVLSKSGPSKTCWRTEKRNYMLDYERKIFDLDKKH